MGIEATPVNREDGPRQRGEREYFLRRGEYRNPYDAGSDDFNAYERGWMQSLKRTNGNLVSLSAPASAPARTLPSVAGYNAYAELKGRSGPRKRR